MAKTSITLESETRDRLRAEKQGGETYGKTIERLLSRPPREFQIRLQGEGPDMQFVEVETLDGESITLGEWEQEGDYWLIEVTE